MRKVQTSDEFCALEQKMPFRTLGSSYHFVENIKRKFPDREVAAYQIGFPQGNLDLGFCAKLFLSRTGRGRAKAQGRAGVHPPTVLSPSHGQAGETARMLAENLCLFTQPPIQHTMRRRGVATPSIKSKGRSLLRVAALT